MNLNITFFKCKYLNYLFVINVFNIIYELMFKGLKIKWILLLQNITIGINFYHTTVQNVKTYIVQNCDNRRLDSWTDYDNEEFASNWPYKSPAFPVFCGQTEFPSNLALVTFDTSNRESLVLTTVYFAQSWLRIPIQTVSRTSTNKQRMYIYAVL